MVDTIASLFSPSRDSSPRFGGSAAAAPDASGFAALVDRFDAEASRALAPAAATPPRRLAESRSAAHADRSTRQDDARDRAPDHPPSEARRDRATVAHDRVRSSRHEGRPEDGDEDDDDDDGSSREASSTRSQTDASPLAASPTVVGAGFGIVAPETVGEAALGSLEGGSPAGAATVTTGTTATSVLSDATTAAPADVALRSVIAAATAEGPSDGTTTSAPSGHAELRDGKEAAGPEGQAGDLAVALSETEAPSPGATAGPAADAGLAQAGVRGTSSDGVRTAHGERRAADADALGLTAAAARPEDRLPGEAVAASADTAGGEETGGDQRAEGRPELPSQPGAGAGVKARGGPADDAAPTVVALPRRTHQAAGKAGAAPASAPDPTAPSTGPAISAPAHGSAPATSSAASAKTFAAQPARVKATPDGVGSALRQVVKRGQDRVEIRLDPPRLGRLKIEVRRGQDGTLQVRLHAEQHEAAEMLRRSTRQLEAILGRDGVRLDRIEVIRPALEARTDAQETPLPQDGRQAGSGSGGEAGTSGDRTGADGSASSRRSESGWGSPRIDDRSAAAEVTDGWRGDRLDAIA